MLSSWIKRWDLPDLSWRESEVSRSRVCPEIPEAEVSIWWGSTLPVGRFYRQRHHAFPHFAAPHQAPQLENFVLRAASRNGNRRQSRPQRISLKSILAIHSCHSYSYLLRPVHRHSKLWVLLSALALTKSHMAACWCLSETRVKSLCCTIAAIARPLASLTLARRSPSLAESLAESYWMSRNTDVWLEKEHHSCA